MEERLYDELATLGDTHWWCVGRRRIVRSVLVAALPAGVPGRRQVLDVGCGTGDMLAMLTEFGDVQALDMSPQAVAYCQARLGDAVDVRVGGIPDDVPSGAAVDLLTAFDVIEHLDDDAGALDAFRAALRPGGTLVVTVPAFQWMWSGHDVINHHKRRYTRRRLVRTIRDAGFEVERASYFNTILFPIAAAARLVGRIRPTREPESDLTMPPAPVNKLLASVFAAEARPLRKVNLPVGVSLVAVARRPTA